MNDSLPLIRHPIAAKTLGISFHASPQTPRGVPSTPTTKPTHPKKLSPSFWTFSSSVKTWILESALHSQKHTSSSATVSPTPSLSRKEEEGAG